MPIIDVNTSTGMRSFPVGDTKAFVDAVNANPRFVNLTDENGNVKYIRTDSIIDFSIRQDENTQ